jgi:hypothetical protein
MIRAYEAEASHAAGVGDSDAVDRLDQTRQTLERGVFIQRFQMRVV